MSDTQPNVYETCDPTYLQQLRGQVGMDVVQLARIACLSVAQVKSLETGRDDLFYSMAIKRQAYKRALMILGAPPPVTFIASQRDDVVAPALVAPVEDGTSPSHAVFGLSRQKRMFVALAVAMIFGGLAVFYPSEDDVSMTLMSAASPVMVEPAPVAVTLAPVQAASAVVAATVHADSVCAFSTDPGPEVSPATPKKEGRFVYLLSATDASLCVVDGNKQANPLQLKAGEGRSVYGVSPWQISGNNLTQVQIYFQGWRANLPEGIVQKIVLVEKALTP